MMLLLDQGLQRSTVARLAARGIAAEHVGDLGMSRSADDWILDAARQKQATVVTLAGAEIAAGAAVSVTQAQIRVRLLPIGRI